MSLVHPGDRPPYNDPAKPPTSIEEKALELLAENRVILQRDDTIVASAIVAGHHAHYSVMAHPHGIECSCPARTEYCAHKLAAMVRWAERAEELKPPW